MHLFQSQFFNLPLEMIKLGGGIVLHERKHGMYKIRPLAMWYCTSSGLEVRSAEGKESEGRELLREWRTA